MAQDGSGDVTADELGEAWCGAFQLPGARMNQECLTFLGLLTPLEG